MRTKYRFVNAAGVETLREWHDDEFHAHVQDGVLKIPSRMGGKPTEWKLVGTAPSVTHGVYSSCWPMKCDAVGVELCQVQDAMAEATRIGVPTDFDPETGQAILRDPGHYKRYLEAIGHKKVGGKGGGYRDPCGLSAREREIRAMAGNAVRKTDDDGVMTMHKGRRY